MTDYTTRRNIRAQIAHHDTPIISKRDRPFRIKAVYSRALGMADEEKSLSGTSRSAGYAQGVILRREIVKCRLGKYGEGELASRLVRSVETDSWRPVSFADQPSNSRQAHVTENSGNLTAQSVQIFLFSAMAGNGPHTELKEPPSRGSSISSDKVF